jgi:hypothetical protein
MKEYEAARKARRDDNKKQLGSEWDSDNYIDDSRPPQLSDDEDDSNLAQPKPED